MALKAFIPKVDFSDTGISIKGPVFDTGVVVRDQGGNVQLVEGFATITDAMTPAQVKTVLQTSFIDTFNLRTGRSDGSTIAFVWL